jgi:hypothetical protein
MSLKLCTVQVLAPHAVVTFVKDNAVIVDNPSSIDRSLEISIPLVTIQLELQCFHTLVISL